MPVRSIRCCALALGVVALSACGAEGQPSASAQQEVDDAVRQYIELRNDGDLDRLLATSCDDLYSWARDLRNKPDEERGPIVAAMREHPVRVRSVTAQHVDDYRVDGTLTGSAETPEGRRTDTQRFTVRQYRDGYRVCALSP